MFQSKSQIDLFKNYLYLIGLCAKKKTLKKPYKKCSYEHTMNAISQPVGVK